MLESIDFNKQLSKNEFKDEYDNLAVELGRLQREARTRKRPVMLIFEGIDGAGKGTLINNILIPLDARGVSVEQTLAPDETERHHSFLWRFWTKTPAKGRITIFDRSWYNRIVQKSLAKDLSKKETSDILNDIKNFEHQLTEDGTIIIKFFLHISQKEQKKRFKKLEKNKSTRWRVTKEDWKKNKKYQKYISQYDKIIDTTNNSTSPWQIIESTDERYATIRIMKLLKTILGAALESSKNQENQTSELNILDSKSTNPFEKIDLSHSLTKEQYKTELKPLQKRIRELEHEIYIHRVPVIIVYQGWDAAGKGGNIRRLVEEMDPRGYEVIPIAAPNDVEKDHHYLWRFWNQFPKGGHISIFDRSWYGRVLVERVEGFATKHEWQRAYEEITQMESHLVRNNAVIVKFWLEISKDVQLSRFKERESTPHKQWKITEEDYRNREKWDLYREAVNEMICLTSTDFAPWTIVESNSKYYARIKALKTVINAVEQKLKDFKK